MDLALNNRQMLICHKPKQINEPYKKVYLEYDTELHLVMRIQFWSSGVSGISLPGQYSQVHSELDWLYLLEQFNPLKGIIIIWNHKAMYKLFVFDRNNR